MTNERHEKALEAAMEAWFGPTMMKHVDNKDWLPDMQGAIAAYLKAMDAVIVPKRVTKDMDAAGYDHCPWDILKLDHQTVWYAMLAAAPNHFTNGE